MARRPEESARAILRIIVSGGTKVDEIVLYGNLERAFLEADPNSLAAEFVEGLKYAEGQGMAYNHRRNANQVDESGIRGGIGTIHKEQLAKIDGSPRHPCDLPIRRCWRSDELWNQ